MATQTAKSVVAQVTQVAKTTGLGTFKRLNFRTFLYVPSQKSVEKKDPNSPDLILFASWANAQPKHIAKYIDGYKKIYPDTRILLIRSGTKDFFFNPDSKQKNSLKPALSALLASIPNPEQKLLVHALSNGGTGQLAFLSKNYYETTGKPLPAQALIMDSAPGRSWIGQGINAFTVGLTKTWYIRWPVRTWYRFLLITFYTLPEWFGHKNRVTTLRTYLNSTDPEYINKNANRCYIYSDADPMIGDKDVEDHAKEAQEKGLKVETVKYTGSTHVAHMKADPVRYWSVVKRIWDNSKPLY